MIRKYWAEILTFGVITAILLVDLSPGITWMNTDSDGAHYILAAKYLYPAHNTSAPLFLILGRLFLFIPIGSDAFRMGLISVVATVGGSVLIYIIVRQLLFLNPKARLCAMIASIAYGSSALVISQSTIIETYALSTALMLFAYYLSLNRKWLWVSVAIGLLWAIHTLFAWVIWGVLLIKHKELRDMSLVVVTLSFLLFYLYIPITTIIHSGGIQMWGNSTFGGFIENNLGVLLMLSGGVSMWDLPKRILDAIGIIGVSLGFGFIVVLWQLIKMRKWKYDLLWLFLIPICWFVTNLATETYVYMMPSIAFGAIILALGLSRLNYKVSVAMLLSLIIVGGFNTYYLDIGRTLDPEMSAEKFYNEELVKIPDGDIFMGGGWNWAMVYLYNKEEGRNIIPLSTDIFPSKAYQAIISDMGIEYESPEDGESFISLQGKMALSVAELNEGVWIAKEIKPEVYQYIVEPALGNEEYIGRWIGQEIEPEWRWRPSNPYHYITGALEVSEWNHILLSNINANVVISLAIYSLAGYWLVLKMWDKRRNKQDVFLKTQIQER